MEVKNNGYFGNLEPIIFVISFIFGKIIFKWFKSHNGN